MSAEATFWAWSIRSIKGTKKLVLLCLADNHNDATGRCDPGAKYVAKKTGLDVKTVYAALDILEDQGLISKVDRPGKTPDFTLHTSTKNGNTENGSTQKRVYPKKDQGLPKNGLGVYPKTGNESSINLKEPKNNSRKAASPPCPHQEIIKLYNETLPELQQVIGERWGGTREKNLSARWKESPKHQNLEFWQRFFTRLRQEKFYMGENDRGWAADLGWLLQRNNFDKLLERFMSAPK